MIGPKTFFITKGSSQNDISGLNAYDEALRDAGISQCNIVQVSSILPKGAKHVRFQKIPAGEITFCVLARCDGDEGDRVGAGIAYSFCKAASGNHYGIVAEVHGDYDAKELKQKLKMELERMARVRKMKLGKMVFDISVINSIRKNHGCAVCALVYRN